MGTTGDCNHQWNRLTRSQRISVRNSELTTEIIGNPLNSVEVLCIFMSFHPLRLRRGLRRLPCQRLLQQAPGPRLDGSHGHGPPHGPMRRPRRGYGDRLPRGALLDTVGTVVVQAKKKEDEDPTIAISKYLSGVLRHNAVAGPSWTQTSEPQKSSTAQRIPKVSAFGLNFPGGAWPRSPWRRIRTCGQGGAWQLLVIILQLCTLKLNMLMSSYVGWP